MNIGEQLKNRREEKNLSLYEISDLTKIPVNLIINIENNDFKSISGRFYAVSFLRTYAKYLDFNINIDEIIPPEQGKNEEKLFFQKRLYVKNRNTLFKNIVMLIMVLSIGLVVVSKNDTETIQKKEQLSIPVISKIPAKKIIKKGKNGIWIKGISRESTWIRVIADKSRSQSTLKTGATYYWYADKHMNLRIGNVRGIDIFYKKNEDGNYAVMDIIEGNTRGVNEIDIYD
ncbi:helix-turn-helix domain-containing protein [Elusimicrobiota bacterium]